MLTKEHPNDSTKNSFRRLLQEQAHYFLNRVFPVFAADSTRPEARIEILPEEVLGTISPNIYGHFVENLSGVIYDGIWVGENFKVPNIHGVRKDLVDEMRKISPSVVRFPGGCFADSYDWKDGIRPGREASEADQFLERG